MRTTAFTALIWCLLRALPCLADPAVTAADLQYLSDDHPPYNYQEFHQPEGLLTDFLFAMWEEMGVKPQPIEFLPWARAYAMATRNPLTVLYSTIRTPERESQFKWVGPVLKTKVALIGLNDFNKPITCLEDAFGLRVGVIKAHAEASLLQCYRKDLQLDVLASSAIAVNKLMAGRLDLVFFDRRAFEHVVQKNRIPLEKFRIIYEQPSLGIYYALSRDVPDSLVSSMQAACDAVRQSPAYAAILKQHLGETAIYTQAAP